MTEAGRVPRHYQLSSELARAALHATESDPGRRLAWVNSICFLFLLIGILGARFGSFAPRPVAPLELSVPAIVEPLPPRQTTPEPTHQEEHEQEKSDAPQVVVVTPDAPNITFWVPTIGNLVVPSAIATAPPLNPLRPPAPLKEVPANLSNTGAGGDRPEPPYPKIALEAGQHGTVVLLMAADEQGNITSVEVKNSSGSAVLDRSSLDYVKRRWRLPPGSGTRLFETSINYRLAPN